MKQIRVISMHKQNRSQFQRLNNVVIVAVCWLGYLTDASAQTTTGGVSVFNAASYAAQVAPDSIAAAFLNQPTIQASSAQTAAVLPTTLAGVSLEINGRVAGLIYVGPTQINFVVPEQTSPGNAAVSVRLNGSVVANGFVVVQAVAPGIFTMNGAGQGVPAALIYPGTFSPVPAFAFINGLYVPAPIDLCATADEVVLVVFLTGVGRAADPKSLRVVIGNRSLPLVYAGKQGEFAGLDQFNLVLPPELANRGLNSLALTAPGNISSNLVDLDSR